MLSASFGILPGAAAGFITQGGAAWIQGGSGMQIGLSSLFGLFGGGFGGAGANAGLQDLALTVFFADLDFGIFSNLVGP